MIAAVYALVRGVVFALALAPAFAEAECAWVLWAAPAGQVVPPAIRHPFSALCSPFEPLMSADAKGRNGRSFRVAFPTPSTRVGRRAQNDDRRRLRPQE
jgi:hypothetical protein